MGMEGPSQSMDEKIKEAQKRRGEAEWDSVSLYEEKGVDESERTRMIDESLQKGEYVRIITKEGNVYDGNYDGLDRMYFVVRDVFGVGFPILLENILKLEVDISE